MNLKNTLILTGGAIALLSGAQSASAQTKVYLTGSTAFRSATHAAIQHVLASGYTYGYVGSSLGGAGAATFIGTVGGNPVIIKTSWSGAVGGVQTVAGSIPVKFLPDSINASLTTGGLGSQANPNTAGNPNESVAPDVAMTDNYQGSTVFTSPTLVDTVVGVVPFKWVASKGAPAGLSNLTPSLAQVLWGNGSIPLALFTGQTADQGTLVYATGRDPDSGTRLSAFAEAGIGVNATVTQYKPTISGGAVTAYNPYPVQTVNGITFPLGQGGEASGGTLATNMTATTNSAVGYSVTYVGLSDATTAINGGAKELTWMGTSYSATAVAEGSYPFWSYEHLMYKSSLAGVKKSTADAIANQIINVDSPVLLSTMQVGRQTDGGVITPNY